MVMGAAQDSDTVSLYLIVRDITFAATNSVMAVSFVQLTSVFRDITVFTGSAMQVSAHCCYGIGCCIYQFDAFIYTLLMAIYFSSYCVFRGSLAQACAV
ncbi:hypothetical protein Tco_1478006 [Tanacetum coccineum]